MDFLFLSLGYHPDRVGGAYRYVAEVARGLAARGHSVDVVYPAITPAAPARESREGVELRRYPNQEGFFVANWLRENSSARALVRSILGERRSRVLPVLCHAYLAPALRDSLSSSVFLFTGPWGQEYLLARSSSTSGLCQNTFHRLIAFAMCRVERCALRRVRRILTISQYYARALAGWHGKRLAPVQVISGGVDTDHFRPLSAREAIRSELGLEQRDFLFVSIRRLEPRMGLSGLIRAFGPIAEQFPHARLWIAGTGGEKQILESLITDARLQKKVRLLGYVPEDGLPRLLNAADCSIVPSLDLEGFGLATVESLACGTPVLGSRAGATPELLGPLSEDLLFTAGSDEALGSKIKSILASPLSLPSRERCRAHVLQQFTWDGPVRAFERAFAELDGKA